MATVSTLRSTRPSQTKIVATVGPACGEADQLAELIVAGVDVFRVNLAHGDRAEHQDRLAAIRTASAKTGRPVAVLVDLAGPKIRLGHVPGDCLTLDADSRVRFVGTAHAPSPPEGHRGDCGSEAEPREPVPGQPSAPADPPELTTSYEPLMDELALGDRVMLADGTVSLLVEEKGEDYALCRVIQPGVIRSRQGVNLPGVKLSAPALGPADRAGAAWAAQNEIDFVGLSFVRAADEVRQLKALLAAHGSQAQVIAKIEKPEAMDHLREIVEAADGVMVARGDLGVEIDIARVAVAQKQIVAVCDRCRKPVIIATQMLDSMQHARLPTRAEVTDVANAILDGADACMLSGETAVGEHPRLAVEMMHRIALATEPLCRERSQRTMPDLGAEGVNAITEATVFAAGRLAEALGAQAVVVASASGATALSLAKNRHYVPTIGVSDSAATLRRMSLYWGIIPLPGAPTANSKALLEYVTDFGRKAGVLSDGGRIVLIAGTGLKVTAHNMIVVHELE